MPMMAGAAGAVVSMVTGTEALDAPLFNAASVALAVKVWLPAARDAVNSQAPEALDVAVPRTDEAS